MHQEVTTAKEFDAAIANGCVLVDFWATWCGPCMMMAQNIDDAIAAGSPLATIKIVKVNVDQAQELAAKFGIVSIPTLLCYRDGIKCGEFIGVTPIDEIVAAFG